MYSLIEPVTYLYGDMSTFDFITKTCFRQSFDTVSMSASWPITDEVVIYVLLPLLPLSDLLTFASINRKWRSRLKKEDVWRMLHSRDYTGRYFTKEEASIVLAELYLRSMMAKDQIFTAIQSEIPPRLGIKTMSQLFDGLPLDDQTGIKWQAYVRTQSEAIGHLKMSPPNKPNLPESYCRDDICVITGGMALSKFAYLTEHCVRVGIRPMTAKHKRDTWFAAHYHAITKLLECMCPFLLVTLLYLAFIPNVTTPLWAMEIVIFGGFAPMTLLSFFGIFTNLGIYLYHRNQHVLQLLPEALRGVYVILPDSLSKLPYTTGQLFNELLVPSLFLVTLGVIEFWSVLLFSEPSSTVKVLGGVYILLSIVAISKGQYDQIKSFPRQYDRLDVGILVWNLTNDLANIALTVLTWIHGSGLMRIAYIIQAIPVMIILVLFAINAVYLNRLSRWWLNVGLFIPILVTVILLAWRLDGHINWSLGAIFAPLIPSSLVVFGAGIHNYRQSVQEESRKVRLIDIRSIWSEARLTPEEIRELQQYRSRLT